MSVEYTLKLLWDLGNTFQPENHTKRLLKSFYLTTCKKVGKNSLQLPSGKFSVAHMCPKCSSLWSDGRFSLRLQPQKIRSSKAKKLVDTFEDSETRKSLTKKQKIRAKWLKKKTSSHMEITCNLCQKKTIQSLTKPQLKIEVSNAVNNKSITKPKKKKKVKIVDKSAGLKIPTSDLANKNKTILATTSPACRPKETNCQPTGHVNMNKMSMKKPKQKHKKSKVKKPAALQFKQSKTQKKNSILKLTSLLKQQSNLKIDENRLQQFLK